jgi:hypothetical protein
MFQKPYEPGIIVSLIQERGFLDIRFFSGSNGFLSKQQSTFRKDSAVQSRNIMQRADSPQVKQQIFTSVAYR